MGNVINEEQKGGREVGERRDDVINEASVALDVVPGSSDPTPVPERPHFINLEDATDPAQMGIRTQRRELSAEAGVSKVSDGGVYGFMKSLGVFCGGGGSGRKESAHFGRSNRSPAPWPPALSPGSTSRRRAIPALESPGVVSSVGDISEPAPSDVRLDAGGAGEERPAGGAGGRCPGLA